MAEAIGRHPLAARRWRTKRHWVARWRVKQLDRRLIAAALLLVAVMAAVLLARGGRPEPRASYRAGLAALADGRFDEARRALVAALPAEPMLAQLALARRAVEEGDEAAAALALQRATAAGAGAAQTRAFQAAVLLLQGDADGALAATAAGPASALAVRVRARAQAATGDVTGGERSFAWLLARRPADAAAWSDLGRLRLDRGDVAGAGEAARRALAAVGGWPPALVLQAEVVRSRYGYLAALPWYDAALRRDPAHVPALLGGAATRGEAGRYAGALADARAALALRPGALQPVYLMAVVAARAGRPALALRLLQRLGDATDGVPGARLLAGLLQAATGHPDLAVAQWRGLLDAQPMNLVARRLLGAALLRTGDAAGALETLAPLVSRADADAYALEVAARAARATGDLARAAALHDRAIAGARGPAAPFAGGEAIGTLQAMAADAPGDLAAAVALIGGHAASGDPAAAIARAQSLAVGAPGIASAQVVLGDALFLAGRSPDAAAAYARAADLAFDEPTVLRLAEAAVAAGRSPDAAAALALFLSQHPQAIGARTLAAHWQAMAAVPEAGPSLDALVRAIGVRHAALLADRALARARRGDAAGARRYAAAAYRLQPMNPAVIDGYARILAAAGDGDGVRQLRAKLATLSAPVGPAADRP